MDFVHLHTYSDYSIFLSTLSVKAMLNRAYEYGMSSIALTDLNNMYGAVELVTEAKRLPTLKNGKQFNPIIGIEINFHRHHPQGAGEKPNFSHRQQFHTLVLLAENLEGYHNLCRLSSVSFEDDSHHVFVTPEHLKKFSKGCIALTSGSQGELYHLAQKDHQGECLQFLEQLQSIFGPDNLFLEIQNHEYEEQKKVNQRIIDLSSKTQIPLVATNQVRYLNNQDWISWDILYSIGEKQYIQVENNRIVQNRSVFLPGEGYHLKSQQEMEIQFSNYPQALLNTVQIAQRCQVDIIDTEKHMPSLNLSEEADVYLRKEATRRLNVKKPDFDQLEDYQARLEYELSIIVEMNFSSYFILVADFIHYARNNNIMVGAGRGSAAGSLVSYAMGITSLDPIEYGLYFERFLNPERISFPDIDIDFQDDGRDQVIQYVRDRYGAQQVAQIITFGKLKSKAVFKDVSRVFGVEFATANKISALIRGPSGENEIEKSQSLSPLEFNYEYNLEFSSVVNSTPIFKMVYEQALKLEGLTRQTSIHAAGVVVADKPLTEYVPLVKSSDDVWITQYEGTLLESNCGLLKIDFLGIRTLTLLQKCVEDIKRIEGIEVDIIEPPLDDKKTFTLFSQGLTAGIFQFESDGMTRYLKDLMPNDIKELTAMNALYRPGPMAWIPVYIAKKHNRSPAFDSEESRNDFNQLEAICRKHAKLNATLQETRGIPFYQEQIMEICKVYAGFTLGSADNVRKAMGKKDKDLIQKVRSEFIEKAVAMGNPHEDAEFLYDKIIIPFAGYGFNKSHSACYAYLAYQTAYLKANHPISFITALMNSEMDSTQQKFNRYLDECFLLSIDVFPPDINYSYGLFTSSKENILFGLAGIKNIGLNVAKEITQEREKNGPYKDPIDFILRHSNEKVSKLTIEMLVKAGCFDYTHYKADQWLSVLEEIHSRLSQQREQRKSGQLNLFEQDNLDANLDVNTDIYKRVKSFPSRREELYRLEKESLGFNLRYEPLLLYRDQLAEVSNLDLEHVSGGKRKHGTLGCVIRKVLIFNDKKNKPMARFEINDGKSSHVVICFSGSWEKIKATLPATVQVLDSNELSAWLESKPVAMKISISPANKQSGSQVDLFLDGIDFLEEGDSPEISSGEDPKTIWIQLVKGMDYHLDELNQINQIIEKYPGKNQVKLVFWENQDRVIYPLEKKVEIAFSMRVALNQLKIIDNIKITDTSPRD